MRAILLVSLVLFVSVATLVSGEFQLENALDNLADSYQSEYKLMDTSSSTGVAADTRYYYSFVGWNSSYIANGNSCPSNVYPNYVPNVEFLSGTCFQAGNSNSQVWYRVDCLINPNNNLLTYVTNSAQSGSACAKLNMGNPANGYQVNGQCDIGDQTYVGSFEITCRVGPGSSSTAAYEYQGGDGDANSNATIAPFTLFALSVIALFAFLF